MNKEIIGIETREMEEYIDESRFPDDKFCPIIQENCIGVQIKEIYNHVCNRNYETCFKYNEIKSEL